MKLEIIPQTFYSKTWELLREIDSICSVFYGKGYTVTLRQLFYQLVSRNRIPNIDKAYTNLGNVVRDGRYAGVLDWAHITDRVRVIHDCARWADPEDRLVHAAQTYRIDTWPLQKYRPEVWMEKDALIELAENVCDRFDVQYMSVKAYSSVSALWEARKRFREYVRAGQTPLILHLGDHDCTGADCSRFLRERMELMVNTPDLGFHADVELRRLALNADQIERYELPPQPGKTQDPRFKGYVKKHGTTHVWELDALAPEVIEDVIENGIRAALDDDLRQVFIASQESQRKDIEQIGENYQAVREFAGLMSNGDRDHYEAWRQLSSIDFNLLENQALPQKLSMPNFHRMAAPVPNERDAEIAEQYAAALGVE